MDWALGVSPCEKIRCFRKWGGWIVTLGIISKLAHGADCGVRKSDEEGRESSQCPMMGAGLGWIKKKERLFVP